MQKGSRRGVAIKSEAPTAKEPDIPPEIAQFIKEQSVRIDPDRFFSKELRAKLPLIEQRLKESPPNTFTLEPKLFEDFISSLRLLLKNEHPVHSLLKPSDWIPFVLVALATGTEVRSPFDVYFDREGYWEHISLPSSLIAPGNRPGATPSGSDQQDSSRRDVGNCLTN